MEMLCLIGAGITATINSYYPRGQELTLRWEDLNDAGNDHFMPLMMLRLMQQRSAQLLYGSNNHYNNSGNTQLSVAFTAPSSDGVLRLQTISTL